VGYAQDPLPGSAGPPPTLASLARGGNRLPRSRGEGTDCFAREGREHLASLLGERTDCFAREGREHLASLLGEGTDCRGEGTDCRAREGKKNLPPGRLAPTLTAFRLNS